MRAATPIDIVIPALDEELSLPQVLGEIPHPLVRRVIVADNGSRDRTAEVAAAAGAVVVSAPRRGYGSACLAALAYLRERFPPRIVVFLDADGSADPGEIPALVAPIFAGELDFVVGARVRERRERRVLLPHARFGNALACAILRRRFASPFTDLGPFRAIAWSALDRLAMRDHDFGWTAEMQVKALARGLACGEVPVRQRRSLRPSKVSGTVRGSLGAATKILAWTLGVVR